MKTLGRLIRRNVFTTFGVIVLVLVSNFLILGAVAAVYDGSPKKRTDVVMVADSFAYAENGALALDQAADATMKKNWVWGMLLNDDGDVIWQYNLPKNLDRHYTVGDVAGFTRYYLDDYPTQVYRNDYGIVVLGSEKNSVWKYTLQYAIPMINTVKQLLPALVAVELLVILLICVLIAWFSYRALGHVMLGIDAMAEGEPVTVPEKGIALELAHKLNRTSEHLQSQNALIARRDNARTNWVAGVSHDIRTPLAIIMGNAEQICSDPATAPENRRKADAIRTQSLKIKELIADLNLTSKLQYNAQPLRRTHCKAGSLLRGAVTEFCNSGAAESCAVDFNLSPSAENAMLDADEGLIVRALDNILGNSARHNPDGCQIKVHGDLYTEGACTLLEVCVTDDGVGYPPAVISALCNPQQKNDADQAEPHILGLHVVEQIAAAHGGRAIFAQNTPHGAKTLFCLPILPSPEKRGKNK